MQASKGYSPLGAPLSPAGYAVKEGCATLVRVGDVQPLTGQEHLHLHTLVQLHQLIGSLHAVTGRSLGMLHSWYLGYSIIIISREVASSCNMSTSLLLLSAPTSVLEVSAMLTDSYKWC